MTTPTAPGGSGPSGAAPLRPERPRRRRSQTPAEMERHTALIKQCIIVVAVAAAAASLVRGIMCPHTIPVRPERRMAADPETTMAILDGQALDAVARPDGPPPAVTILLLTGAAPATDAAHAVVAAAARDIEKLGRSVRTLKATPDTELFQRAMTAYAPAALPAVAVAAAGCCPVILTGTVTTSAVIDACDRSAAGHVETGGQPASAPAAD